MQKFMCTHTVPVGAFSAEQICELAESAQHDPHIRGYRSFFNLSEGKALCVLEAHDRETLIAWFQEKGIPYDDIMPVELEGDRGTIQDLREQPVAAGVC